MISHGGLFRSKDDPISFDFTPYLVSSTWHHVLYVDPTQIHIGPDSHTCIKYIGPPGQTDTRTKSSGSLEWIRIPKFSM